MIAYDTRDGRKLIEDAIAENGAIEVLKAAALAVIRGTKRPKSRPPDAAGLSGYIRRDIGLPAEPEAPDWNRYLP
jgi:hypothetical protein